MGKRWPEPGFGAPQHGEKHPMFQSQLLMSPCLFSEICFGVVLHYLQNWGLPLDHCEVDFTVYVAFQPELERSSHPMRLHRIVRTSS